MTKLTDYSSSGDQLIYRMRRLRYHPKVRELVEENHLSVSDLIYPLFIRERGEAQPVESMPGQSQITLEQLATEVAEVERLKIPAVLLFGIPDQKDETGSSSWAESGVIQQATRRIKETSENDLLVITDLCFCEYTSHGHCGVLGEHDHRSDVANDSTLENLGRQAVSHCEAGADVIAPSGMMDGMVAAIRQAMDLAGYERNPIMSYAAKYASGFYGPFRDAAESAPQFGDRRTYQMNPANAAEALREVQLDIEEGADIVMVKPALAYMDIVRRVKETFGLPTAVYNVSGEYSMVKAAAANGWIDERRLVLEILTGFKRAGADMIITYHAKEVASWIGSGN